MLLGTGGNGRIDDRGSYKSMRVAGETGGTGVGDTVPNVIDATPSLNRGNPHGLSAVYAAPVCTPCSLGCLGVGGTSCTQVFVTEEEGPAVMTYVGYRNGNFTQDFKYVGDREGEYKIVQSTRFIANKYVCWILGLLATIVLASLALWMVFSSNSAATTSPSIPQLRSTTLPHMEVIPPPTPLPALGIGTCVLRGDPHIDAFDHSHYSLYGNGEYWIVKSPKVHLQARLMGTNFTHGLAATNELVVGGPFIDNHTITVGTVDDGDVTVDGEKVLETIGSNYSIPGLFTLLYNTEGELVDWRQVKNPRHIVHMHLPMGVRIMVLRWSTHMDLKIDMSPQEGQDGACGNFNDDPSDDTAEAIMTRIGARVPAGELMFKKRAFIAFTAEMMEMMQTKCPRDRLTMGSKYCKKWLSVTASETEVNSCVFDVCFSEFEKALRTARHFA